MRMSASVLRASKRLCSMWLRNPMSSAIRLCTTCADAATDTPMTTVRIHRYMNLEEKIAWLKARRVRGRCRYESIQ
eukprot:768488-Hanusia_phi.AAC.1